MESEDRADPEQVGDVDDAQAADLHVVAGDMGPAAVQHVAHQTQLDHVVGHQPVAAFHQRQRGLALAHAAGPLDQHPHAEHFEHHSVHLHRGCEHEREQAYDARGELGGGQRCLQHRASDRFRQAQKVVGGIDAVG